MVALRKGLATERGSEESTFRPEEKLVLAPPISPYECKSSEAGHA